MNESREDAFFEFERQGWRRAARAYETGFLPLTSQVVGPLLDAVDARAGVRLLDVASGPGELVGAARARGAEAIGVDVSDEMVAVARARHPGCEFRVARAEELPFADGEFGAVTMSFLLGHLGDPARVLTEIRRVLASGGTLATSWWDRFDRVVAMGLLLESVRENGRMDVGLPQGPPFDQFGDPEVLARALSDAGFESVAVRTLELRWRLESFEAFFAAYYDGSVRSAGLLRGQTPAELAAIRADLEARARRFRSGGIWEFPMPAHVATGRNP